MESGYYRYVRPNRELEEQYTLGELWYLLDVVGGSARLIYGDEEWTFDLDEFEDSFEFVPNGLEERQKQIIELTTSLHNIGDRQDSLRLENKDAPSIEEEDVESLADPGTAIALSNKNPLQAKANLKKTKTLAARARKQIARKQAELARFTKEQELILREKVNALTKTVKQIEQVVYVINAYLGQDEEIVQIADGEPADADAKIVMRQTVLYMDEETAAASNFAKRGGLDWKTIEEFDQWVVSNPKHLEQMLPEEKGVVAIKPRRNDKHYSDNAFENAELNRQNKCLYILIRNGEKIFRIYTTLWLHDVFFPRKDEFDRHFVDRWDRDRRLRPGSRAYMNAMEEAEADQRRYYTVLVLLQGLLDRTKVFEPLPPSAARVNLLDFNESTKYATFLYDAEMVLGDGRPAFSEWLDDINNRIDVGCRIIFEEVPWGESEIYVGGYSKKRQYPQYATRPNGMELHRIEKREDEEGVFKFYYSREGETVYHGWGDWEGQPAKNRASFLIRCGDEFVLNFDAATVEEMEYYIASRLHRHEYAKMIPLMQHAIKLKKKEKREEAPFRKLLIGEIMKACDASHAAAKARIDELISWWKFKNRNHRALEEDDAKAIRMITREFKKREKLAKAEEEKSSLFKEVVEELRRDEPNTLSIWHKGDNQYAAYLWHNDKNIWVREETWELKKDENLVMASAKDWKVVDSRYESWTCLWKHDRWDEWPDDIVANDHLTDPELEEAIEMGRKQLPDVRLSDHREKGKAWRLPLAVIVTDNHQVHIYYAKRHAVIPNELIVSNSVEYVEADILKVKWEKKRTGVNYRFGGGRYSIDLCNRRRFGDEKPEKMPWDKDVERVVAIYEENIALAKAENDKVTEHKKRVHDMLMPYRCLDTQIRDVMLENFYAREKAKFLEQYYDEDDELWDDYKEDLKDKPGYPRWVDNAVGLLVERDIEVEGLTVEQLVEKASEFGFEWNDHYDFDEVKDIVLDINYGKDKDDEPEFDPDDYD